MVGVTVDHRLHAPANYSIAADDVSRAVAQARALPEIDPTMVAL